MRRGAIGVAALTAALTAALALATVPASGETAGPTPAGVTWAGIHFTSQTTLASWLTARGVRYDDWARRHPRGVYLLTHAPAKAPVVSRFPITSPLTTDAQPPRSRTLALVFAAVSVLLLAIGAAGGAAVRLAHVSVHVETVNLVRLAATAGGAAVALGAAVAWAL